MSGRNYRFYTTLYLYTCRSPDKLQHKIEVFQLERKSNLFALNFVNTALPYIGQITCSLHSTQDHSLRVPDYIIMHASFISVAPIVVRPKATRYCRSELISTV